MYVTRIVPAKLCEKLSTLMATTSAGSDAPA
jgi:hypothetical protein